MMKPLLSVLVGLVAVFYLVVPVRAQTTAGQETAYSIGNVIEILEQTEVKRDSSVLYTQKVRVRDERTGDQVTVSVGGSQIPVGPEQLFSIGDRVVLVGQQVRTGEVEFAIADHYRIPALVGLLALFAVIVLLISRTKGLASLAGMAGSVIVLLLYMVPAILSGTNPLLVSLIAATVISTIIIYFGHGFSTTSHIALLCMLVTLLSVALLASLVVRVATLTGLGDENAIFLQFPGVESINLQGLLLGGIILAALSVLDDSIVSQVSLIQQLKLAKHEISFSELWRRGMSVGRDHISSLVNTLVLAYAGASLPLFILITSNSTGQPLWYTINNQMIAEEIVRTLTGSIGLVLSIPLTTLVAAYVIHKRK